MIHNPFPSLPLATGDRVAFMTFGFNPRALCGVVVDPAASDRSGNRRIRIASNGRTYLARARWVRRLP